VRGRVVSGRRRRVSFKTYGYVCGKKSIDTSVNIGNIYRGIEKPQTTRVSENQGCEEACGKCTGLRNEMLLLSGVSRQ